MKLEHVAIRTDRLEILKDFYVSYFDGTSNQKYVNPKTGLETYFITFDSGAKLEIMTLPGLVVNKNDPKIPYQSITHLAFSVDSMQEVDVKARQFEAAGFPIVRGPRKTGDGFYEFETLDPDGNKIEITTLGHN
jgi:lactoylglutathione lyase